jgi:hypothetical protein
VRDVVKSAAMGKTKMLIASAPTPNMTNANPVAMKRHARSTTVPVPDHSRTNEFGV